MANPAGVEEYGIEQIKISGVPIAKRLTSVEEIRDGEVQCLSLFTEPDQFRCEVSKSTTEVFLAD